MSMKSIETIFNIDTSDKLISALGQLTNGLDIQYLYLNGDGNFTFKAEMVEETLTDGSKVTNIHLTVQEDDEKVAEHIAKNAQLLGGLI